MKSEKIDVLHIHRSDLYMVAVCAWLANVRVIKTVHSVFKHRKHTYLYGVSQRFIARKIFKVNYHSIGESVHKNESHYYHNRFIRINNWFDNKSFFPIKSIEVKHTLREKLEIKNDQFVIISVGSCSIIKNHSDIIRSVAHLNESINCTYIHLGIGEEEENEKKLANELGISELIRFLGNKKNVRDYLVCADVYVMTSKFEGLGNAALEAMALVPCIFYNVPGVRDLIKNNNNGFLISPSIKNLTGKLLKLYNDPALREKMGSSALNYVEKNFSMNKNVMKIIEFIIK